MPKKIRRTKALPTPVIINRPSKTFTGFRVTADPDDNVTMTALWDVPREDGTIDKVTKGVDAAAIQALAGWDAIVDAIVAASA